MNHVNQAALAAVFCTLLLLAADLSIAAPQLPLVTIPKLSTAPAIDGTISEAEWSAAAGPGLFRSMADGMILSQQPRLLLGYDDANFYLAARLPFTGDKPFISATRHDDAVYLDDALEVFLQPAGSDTYYQFVVNAAAVKWDGKDQSSSWNAPWDASAHIGQSFWTVEIAIPFSAIGQKTPSEGVEWRLNIAWDAQGPHPFIGTWSLITGSLHQPDKFATGIFRATAPAFQILHADLVTGRTEITGRAMTYTTPVSLQMSIKDAGGDLIAEFDRQLIGNPPVPFSFEAAVPTEGNFARPGTYTLLVQASAGAATRLLHFEGLFTVPPALGVTVRKYLLIEKLIELDLDVAELNIPPDKALCEVTIRDAANKTFIERHIEQFPAGKKTTLTLDAKTLPPGDYELVVRAFEAGHQDPLFTHTEALRNPPRPDWLGSQEGFSEDLPSPWTPVKLKAGKVHVWGRTYTFDGTPFPARIETAGEQVLAGPIALVGTVNGKPIQWTRRAMSDGRHTDTYAELEMGAHCEDLELSGHVTTEFDGMVRSDFARTPTGTVSIERLALEIPIKREFATYLYHWPGRWSSAFNVGATPENGYEGAFRPYIWLGDEERGLCWFSESDRNFSIQDSDRITQVIPDGDRVILRINLIDHPTTVAEPLAYTFGFQATPVKHNAQDVWDYRICHGGSYGLETRQYRRQAILEYPAEGNINLQQGTFEAWVRPQFDTDPPVAKDEPGRAKYNRSLLDINFPDGDRIVFYWNIDDRSMRLLFYEGDKYTLHLTGTRKLTAGKWHHIAFTWGDEAIVYIDGERAAGRKFAGSVNSDPAKTTITLGAGLCEFDIDELRISDVARAPADFDKPCAADEHTLLLDHLDETFKPDDKRRTSPAKAAGQGALAGRLGSFQPGRFGNAFALYSAADPTTLLDYYAELGVRTICFHEHWTDIQDYTSTPYDQQLRDLVKACHARGIRLLLYFGYEMSNIAPEWDPYHDECLVYPRRGGYHRQPEQTAYVVCYNSAWQDFLVDGIARLIDEYDIDGVYLDGTSEPWACRNLHHGCGYERADGSPGVTYRFFAVRQLMKRIYTVVKSRKPDGLVNVHQSTCMTTPTLAFATSYWDGEQFGSLTSDDPLAVLPLDAFRAEFMGHQWGIPAELLCYGQPYTYPQAMAISLPHDVLVRGGMGRNIEMEAGLWQAMEDFGRHQADWLPYWDNAEYVTTNSANLKVSIYSRGSVGAMVVMSNLGHRKRTMKARFNLTKLGLREPIACEDILSEEQFSLHNRELSFDMEPLTFRIIRLRPGE